MNCTLVSCVIFLCLYLYIFIVFVVAFCFYCILFCKFNKVRTIYTCNCLLHVLLLWNKLYLKSIFEFYLHVRWLNCYINVTWTFLFLLRYQSLSCLNTCLTKVLYLFLLKIMPNMARDIYRPINRILSSRTFSMQIWRNTYSIISIMKDFTSKCVLTQITGFLFK